MDHLSDTKWTVIFTCSNCINGVYVKEPDMLNILHAGLYSTSNEYNVWPI